MQSKEFKGFTRTGLNHWNQKFYDQTILDEMKEKFNWSWYKVPETNMLKLHAESDKLWINGQYPDDLSPDDQLEWIRLLCRCAFSRKVKGVGIETKLEDLKFVEVDEDSERGMKKNSLNRAVFDLTKKTLVDPEVDTVFGKSISVGDSAESPNFFLGEGIGHALTNAQNMLLPEPYRNHSDSPEQQGLSGSQPTKTEEADRE